MAFKQIGSVLKGKDGKPYIKMADGKTFSLESKKDKLEKLDKSLANGKLTEETHEKIKEAIQKIPDYVLFHIIERTQE